MLNLPPMLNPFAPCFYGMTTWMKAQVLLIGALLTPGKRVVSEALRVMGLSESQHYQVRGRRHKSVLERSGQLLKLLRRWLPQRELLVVEDSEFAALDFLAHMQRLKLTFVTRLRMDAALYEPAPPYSGRGCPPLLRSSTTPTPCGRTWH